ncbi:MAG: excinuclease ABC subunit UvrC [Fibromonadaceae bacterium]|jgi:excinuclease ABC subunit C|nr:excinuclease ABC subunit UvrC [Fibromonadaceae bacterium]
MLSSIEARLQNLPASPGVYLMKNAEGKIIYIGKAKLLNKRVRSYFDGREKENHKAAMLVNLHVADIEWIITENETEALILEANLINKHSPYYNIRQKDDKHFPYLMLTTQEKFPRLKITRKIKDDKNLYFGPFVNSHYRLLLDLLPRLFKLRQCKYKLPLSKRARPRPCLNFHIGRCSAPCSKMVSEDVYFKGVREAKMLLEGKSNYILAMWEREMQIASSEMRFEEASKIRDQIQVVQSAFAKQKADATNADLSLDAIVVCKAGVLSTVVIAEYRNGILHNRRHFHLESCLEQDCTEILAEFLPRWYLIVQKEDLPHEIILEAPLGEEHELFEEFLCGLANHKILVFTPQRGNKIGFLRIARANAEMLLVELQAKNAKYNQIDRSIFELQKELKLTSPPFCIECFDISHLCGTKPVASMVRFVNGHPSKSNYRKFKIKTAKGGDDYGSMQEVLRRRLSRLQEEKAQFPDLIMVDGGKGQAEAAFAVLQEFCLENIPLIGLAKRLEEIVFPGSRPSILLKKSSPALQLLQRARDEAHRFAITFQRKRRKL